MSRKQLLLLFLGNLVPWTIGAGLLPLLPIYALQFDASEAVTGYYLAFSFLALAAGTIFGGWLADRHQHRKLILKIAGVIMIPSIWVMSQVGNIWQLAGATAVVWLLVGVTFSVITTLAGLFSGKNERGRVLGLIGMTHGLGSIIGGLSVGPIVDRWGYPTMFLVLSVFSVMLLISAILVKDKKIEQDLNGTTPANTEKPHFGKAFFILLLAQLIVATVRPITNLGRSLSMNNLEFAAAAMTSTSVIGGAVSLPLPLVLGRLSDRLGRQSIMVICYLSYVFGLIMLAASESLWHFWIVMILFRFGQVSMSVGASYVTDLVEPKALGRGISLFQSMGWIATTIGYVVAGNAFQNLGIATTSVISTALPVIGNVLIYLIRVGKKKNPVT